MTVSFSEVHIDTFVLPGSLVGWLVLYIQALLKIQPEKASNAGNRKRIIEV